MKFFSIDENFYVFLSSLDVEGILRMGATIAFSA